MSNTAFKFRLYPEPEQDKALSEMLEAARKLWNLALAHRRWRWEKFRQSTTYNLQQWILTEERKHDPELATLYSQAAQDVLHRLDKAFKAFFKGVAGHPKFKVFNGAGSITYPQAYNGCIKLEHQRLNVSKIGRIPVVAHRDVPESGLKTCTIEREADGSWYAVLTYETNQQVPVTVERFASPVGVDLGLKSLIATSDGEKIPHPQYLRKAERRLNRLQRSLSRKQKGSKNREKARHLLAVQHAKVARAREDFNHKLTTALVKNHDAVFFEDFKIKNMVKMRSLAKSINDAGWGQIRRFAKYKEERRGGIYEEVPAAYTTQDCIYCRFRNHIGLSVREFVCGGCGRFLDRDLHSASSVLARGLQKVGQDMPELKPVETRPPPIQPTGLASQAVEAGTIRGGLLGLKKPPHSGVGWVSQTDAIRSGCSRRGAPFFWLSAVQSSPQAGQGPCLAP